MHKTPQVTNCTECLGIKDKNEFLCRKHFKKLHKLWERKLEESGFEDIEQASTFKSGVPDGNLKQWSTSFFSSPSRFDHEKYVAKEDYYRLAGHFLHEHTFSSGTEKYIWEQHSEGHSISTIEGLLKAKKTYYYAGMKVNRRNLNTTIKRLSTEMLKGLNT